MFQKYKIFFILINQFVK